MYKVLLCWRYLRTRYLALVCIISVMLGVATLIVVNSVMGGFSTKLRARLHGLLSDVIIEAWDYNGFSHPEAKMELIRSDPFLRERIAAMTPTLEIFAMIQFTWHNEHGVPMPMARPIRLIGIDPKGRAAIGGFAEHLVVNRGKPTFKPGPDAQIRYEQNHKPRFELNDPIIDKNAPLDRPPPAPPPSE